MRSRTARGVPEWSGGKDLYMGRTYSVAESVRGFIGIVLGPPKGFRGSTCPGEPYGRYMEGEPAPRWAGRQTPKGPMRLGLKTLGEGAPPPCLGGKSPPPGCHPPSRLDLEGPAPSPLHPINRWGVGGLQQPCFWRIPSLLQLFLLLCSAW